MGWHLCKLYSLYRFVHITEVVIIIHTQSFSFKKASLQVSVQSKSRFFCKGSLKGCVSEFKCTIIWYK